MFWISHGWLRKVDASVEGDSLITQKPSPPLQRNTKKSNQPTPTTNQPPKTLRSFMRKRAKKRTAKSHHGLPFTTHSTFQGFEEIAQQRLHHEVVCLKVFCASVSATEETSVKTCRGFRWKKPNQTKVGYRNVEKPGFEKGGVRLWNDYDSLLMIELDIHSSIRAI